MMTTDVREALARLRRDYERSPVTVGDTDLVPVLRDDLGLILDAYPALLDEGERQAIRREEEGA